MNSFSEILSAPNVGDANGAKPVDPVPISPLKTLISYGLFLGVACLVHFSGFDSPMIYDSTSWILGKERVFAHNDPLRVIGLAPGRPLFMLTLYLNYIAGGVDPFLYRLANAVLLALSGLAFTVLATLVFETPGLRIGGTTKQKRLAAFFLGLFFVIHPLQSYVVLYIWQRSAIMACLFYFTALTLYLGERSGRLQQPVAVYILVQILFLGAILSKENAATLPFALLLAEITLLRPNMRGLVKRIITITLITLPPLIIYVLALRFLHGTESATPPGVLTRLATYYEISGLSLIQVFMTECRVLLSYLSMICMPCLSGVEFIRAEVVSTSFRTPPWTPFAVAGFLGLLSFGCASIRRIPVAAFGILFYIGTSMPEAFLMPKYLFLGYRPILPMAGVLIAVGYAILCLFDWLRERVSPRALKIFVVGLVVIPMACAAPMTLEQSGSWNPTQVWGTAFSRLPSYSRSMDKRASIDVLVNYSSVLIDKGDDARAIEILRRVVDRPMSSQAPGPNHFNDPKILFNLGLALKKSGHLKEAVRYYTMAVQADPRFARGYNNLGLALEELGELAPALAAYRKAIRLRPKAPLVNYNLANVLLKLDHVEEAAKKYLITLSLDPGYTKAYANLGVAQLRSGRFAEAVDSFEKALPTNENNAELYNALGVAYAETGKKAEAIEKFREALAIEPQHDGAAQNLRNVLSDLEESSDR